MGGEVDRSDLVRELGRSADRDHDHLSTQAPCSIVTDASSMLRGPGYSQVAIVLR